MPFNLHFNDLESLETNKEKALWGFCQKMIRGILYFFHSLYHSKIKRVICSPKQKDFFMKYLAITLFFLMTTLNAFANLTVDEFKKYTAGTYKIVFISDEVISADEIVFQIDQDLKITSEEDTVEFQSALNFFDAGIYGNGLPILNVMLYAYSDEQVEGHNLLITADENEGVKLLMMAYSSNDIPNSMSSTTALKKTSLWKLDPITKVFVKVEKI